MRGPMRQPTKQALRAEIERLRAIRPMPMRLPMQPSSDEHAPLIFAAIGFVIGCGVMWVMS